MNKKAVKIIVIILALAISAILYFLYGQKPLLMYKLIHNIAEQQNPSKQPWYMSAAYDSLRKSSIFGNYSIMWDRAFRICEEYNPENTESCKLNICDNLHIGDGNVKYQYPESERCRKEATKYSSCNDSQRNGRETDIDCGGPDCKPCTIVSHCTEHIDCNSGVCGTHGIQNRNICYSICPNGPISNNEPCGCFQTKTPQGIKRKTSLPIDHDVGSTEEWERLYGGNKKVYCCSGVEYYLQPGNDCSSI